MKRTKNKIFGLLGVILILTVLVLSFVVPG